MENGWRRRLGDFLLALLAALVAAWVGVAVHAGVATVLAAAIGVCIVALALLEGPALMRRRRQLRAAVPRAELPSAPAKPSATYDGVTLELPEEPIWTLWRGKSWIVDLQVKVTNDTVPGRGITLGGFRLASDPGSSWAERPRLEPDERRGLYTDTRERGPHIANMILKPGESRIFHILREAFLPYPEREGKPYCELAVSSAEREPYILPLAAVGDSNLPAFMWLRNAAIGGRALRENIEAGEGIASDPSDPMQIQRCERWVNAAARALKPWPDLLGRFQAGRTAATDHDPVWLVQRTELLEDMLRTLEGRPRQGRSPAETALPAIETQPSPPVKISIVPAQDGMRLYLLIRNRDMDGAYSAEVVSILGPDDSHIPGRQAWPVPWLDGSVDPVDLPLAGGATLDFARYDPAAVRADLASGHWGNHEHWWFSSLPDPVGVIYDPARSEEQIWDQRFLVTVRFFRRQPRPNHLDVRCPTVPGQGIQ